MSYIASSTAILVFDGKLRRKKTQQETRFEIIK